MKKHFYSHLLTIDTVHVELRDMDMTEEEAKHLAELAESNLHHTIVDTVLSELSSDDKKEFLKRLHLDDHGEIWVFLNEKSANFEYLIKEMGGRFLGRLHKDIKHTKSR